MVSLPRDWGVADVSKGESCILDRPATGIANNKIVIYAQVVRLNGFERVDGRGLGFADHLDGRLGSHAGAFGGLQSGVLGSIGPDGGARQDPVDLGGSHEGFAVATVEHVHGMGMDLGEVVADGIDNRLVEAVELCGGVLGGYVEG